MNNSPDFNKKPEDGFLMLNERLRLMLLSRAGISVGIILLIGAVGGLGVAWFFIQYQLAPLVEKNLTQTLNRPVQLGRVESFSLTGLQFGSSAIPATSTDPDRLTMEAVDVAFNPLKLLFNRTLQLDVTLVKPDAYIEQDSKGRWVSTSIKAGENKGPIKTDLQVVRTKEANIVLVPLAETGNRQIPVTATQVNGSASFLDQNQRINFDLNGLLASGGNIRIQGENRPAAQQTNLVVSGQKLLTADISRLLKLPLKLDAGRADGNLEVKLRPDEPTLIFGTASLQQATVRIPQVPKLFTQTTGPLAFNGTQIQLQNISTIYGQVPALVNGAVDTQSGYNIAAKTVPVDLKNILNTLDLKLPVAAAGEAQANLKLTGRLNEPILSGTAVTTKSTQIDRLIFPAIGGNFALVGTKLAITGVQATLAVGGQIVGSGSVQLGQKRSAVFDFQGENLPGDAIARIYGSSPPIRIGLVSGKGQVFGPTDNLQTVVALQAPNATYPGRAEVIITPGGKIGLRDAAFQVAGGTVTATGQLGENTWQSNVQASGVQGKGLAPLLGGQVPPALQGVLSGNFQLSGSRSSFKPETIQASGSGRLQVAGGAIAATTLQLSNGSWRGNFSANSVQLGRLSPQVPPALATGQLNGNFNLSGSLTAFKPETIQGSGSARLSLPSGNITASSLQLNNGIWQGNFAANNAQLGRLSPQVPPALATGKLNGNFNLSGSLTAFSPETIQGAGSARLILPTGIINASSVQLGDGLWQGNFAANNIQIGQLSPQIPAQLKSGQLTGNFNLSGSLAEFKPETIQGSGSGRLNLPTGTINASSLQLNNGRWQGNFAANNIQIGQLSPQIPEQLKPGQLTGNFSLSGSLAAFKPETIQGTGSGQLNLPDGSINASSLQLNNGRWQGNFAANDVDLARFAQIPALSRFRSAGVQGRVSGSLNAAGSLTAFNPDAIQVSGQVRLENFAAGGLEFDPVLAGAVNVAPGQGVNVQLAGDQDRIEVVLSSNYRPVSFFVKRDEAVASGKTEGDRLIATTENFPISLLKTFAPGDNAIAAQPLSGRLSGNFDINLATLSATGTNIQIDKPILGPLRGDKLTGNFQYANGVGTLTDAEFQQGSSRYLATGSFKQTPSGPQFQAQVRIPNGQVQEVFTALQVFEVQDLTRGFTSRTYGRAADIPTETEGLPDTALQTQLRRISEIQALLAQQRDRRDASPIPELRDLAGNFTGEINIAGSQKGITASFDIAGSDWKWDNYEADKVIAQGSFENGVLTLLPLRIEMESDKSVLAFSGTFGGGQQSGQLRVQNFPVEMLREFVSLPVDLTGNLNATATVAGSTQNPQARGELSVSEGTLNQTPVQSAQGSFSYEDARLNFYSTAIVSGNDPLQVTGSVPYKLPFAEVTPISNQLSVDVNVQNQGLALITLLSRGQVAWVDGQGKVDLSVRGTVNQTAGKFEQLVAEGVATVENATIEATALRDERLTDVTGKVLFDFDRIQVDSLQGKFSKGQVVVKGVIPISQPRATDNPLTVSLDQLALNIKGRYNGGVNGNVVIKGTALNPEIGGEVQLVNGQVLLEETANAATPTSTGGSGSGASGSGSGVVEFKNLQISLGKGVQITRPPVLNFLAKGDLTINGTLDNIRPQGTVELDRGQVNLFTTQFRLARGYPQTAQFVPGQGLVPNLDVRLAAVVPETTRSRLPTDPLSGEISDVPTTNLGALRTVRIQAAVRGPANQFAERLELTSNPPRTEPEIVSLLGGGFVETLGRGDTTLGLANLAGSAILGNVQNAIGSALGLSEFRLFPTLTQDQKGRNSTLGLSAEAGFDITPKVSGTVSKVLTADDPAQFNVRYRVNDEMLLRGSTNLSGDNRGVVEYEKRF